MQHAFWGILTDLGDGYMTDVQFQSDFFHDKNGVYLGGLYDEDFDDSGQRIPPSLELQDKYQLTYQSFLQHWMQLLAQLQEKAFAHYQKLYAHYYENPEKSGEPALNIDSIEKHNPYILNLLNIHIGTNQTVRLAIRYKLDTEHGLEFLFVNNELIGVGGIAET